MKCITLQVLTIKWLNKHSKKTLWWRLCFANGIQNPKLCVDRSMICNSILRLHWGKFRITVAINVCICGSQRERISTVYCFKTLCLFLVNDSLNVSQIQTNDNWWLGLYLEATPCAVPANLSTIVQYYDQHKSHQLVNVECAEHKALQSVTWLIRNVTLADWSLNCDNHGQEVCLTGPDLHFIAKAPRQLKVKLISDVKAAFVDPNEAKQN